MSDTPRRVECTSTDTPVDFSFFGITKVSELINEEPREQGKKKAERVIVQIPIEMTEEQEKENEKQEYREVVQYKTRCLWLKNNLLADLSGCMAALHDLIVDPIELTWLDLSSNEITQIHPSLCDLKNLKIFYIHGNQIQDLAEVDKLGGMPNLKKLTLHGNPIDNQKGYRSYVLTKVPQLINFDFSGVTRSDRANAASFKIVKPQKKKKHED